LLTGQIPTEWIKDPLNGDPRLADQVMPLAMGHQSQVAGTKQRWVPCFHLKPAVPRCHHMARKESSHRRQGKSPGLCDLQTAVHHAVQVKRVKDLSEWVCVLRRRNGHGLERRLGSKLFITLDEFRNFTAYPTNNPQYLDE